MNTTRIQGASLKQFEEWLRDLQSDDKEVTAKVEALEKQIDQIAGGFIPRPKRDK